MHDRSPPGRDKKKKPVKKPTVSPRVKGAPLNCPLCQSPNIGGMYLAVVNKTVIGCKDCHKLRITLEGKHT